MVAASTIFVFRKREPDTPRPYRTWGYPVVPALFIVAAGILLYYTLADTDIRQNSFVGTLIILAGIPVYLVFCQAEKNPRGTTLNKLAP